MSRHPLFCFKMCCSSIPSLRKQGLSKQNNFEDEIQVEMDVVKNKENESVQQEMELVDSGNLDLKEFPLVISHLRKVYPAKPPKVAVNDLCLAVQQNNIFGMLGENGLRKKKF